MSILDWSFITLLSSALLFVLFAGLAFLLAFSTNKKLKRFRRKPPKDKEKRKRFLSERNSLDKQKSRQRNWGFFCILMMLLTGCGAFYSRYYQMTNLEASDSEAIVQSYYLTDDIMVQLTNIQNDENSEKSIKNLRDVASRLASYGTKMAYPGLTEEGQKTLARHYALIKNLGVNLSVQTTETLSDQQVMEGYVKDIEKVKESQAKVFKTFKVNESALKQKK
ncbi:hypothetical protein ATZ33_14670 [Enterococcus silesiacus]|uniref:Uncharacterized protein n=1 Tax=Enterococcus silesiacus TaxID=332949 RepID=A0A0S3KE90_9ENTE|nr:hypothetical protein [Enterococcus silesiacus]ALS02575.1 hypothetical protein ATZ33_14670 [Enterococcus silesiacus]OJG93504.1 hypothetical protein RV15_GL000106 [Enterococcus silesiacus]